MAKKTTPKTAPKPVENTDEKLVKVKLHTGETHECTESEYLSAKEYYGDNYPGELISE